MNQPRVYMGKVKVWGFDAKADKSLATSTTVLGKAAEAEAPKSKRLDNARGSGVNVRQVLAEAGMASGMVARIGGSGMTAGRGKPMVIKPPKYLLRAVEAQKSSVKAVEEKAVEDVEPIEAVAEAEKIAEAVAEQPKAEEAVEAAVEAEAPVLGETAEVPTEAKGEVVGEELNLFGEVIGAEDSSLSPTEERLTEYLGAAESAVAEVKAAEAARGGEPGGGNVGKGKKKRRKRKHRR